MSRSNSPEEVSGFRSQEWPLDVNDLTRPSFCTSSNERVYA